MVNLNKSFKNEFYYVVLIIVSIQILLGIQGFDVCDDGFALTFYQQIYNNPASVEYNFVYWLSGVVGGVWYELFPQGGIIWFRFFTVVINTASFVLAYHIFKKIMPKRIAILGLLTVLFVNDYGFLTYYHNHLTVFLTLLSVWFLMEGLTRTKALYVLIAGSIIAINVFTRIPNVTLFTFILAIPFYYIIKGENYKVFLRPMALYVFGIIIGVLLIGLLLLALGQMEIMKRALSSLFDLGKTEGSSHNVIGLLKSYIHKYVTLFMVGCQLITLILLFLGVYSYFKNKHVLRNITLFVGFVVAFIWFRNGDIYPIYAIACLGVLLVLLSKSYDYKVKTLAFLGALMLVFLPLGSGGGIKSSGYMCIWLSVPFFFHWFNNLKRSKVSLGMVPKLEEIVIPETSFKVLTLFVAITFLSAKAYNMFNKAYFDEGSRFNKTYTIDSPLARGIYTKERRAVIMNEVLLNLKTYVKPNDYLLIFDKVPMLHFLTETKPYMYNPWVWIYDTHSFDKKLKHAEEHINVYPIVLQQKFETIRTFSEPVPRYLSEEYNRESGDNIHDIKKNQIIGAFLRQHNYELVWSNDYFNIYQTFKENN